MTITKTTATAVGLLGSMLERTQHLHSAKGQQCKANSVEANNNVSVSQRLASGHLNDYLWGNVVTLAGRRHGKRGGRRHDDVEVNALYHRSTAALKHWVPRL
jgi:hypothetical protein